MPEDIPRFPRGVSFLSCFIMIIFVVKYTLFDIRWNVNGDLKYIGEARELIKPERNTLQVSFEDVERYNQNLATTIQEEYYR